MHKVDKKCLKILTDGRPKRLCHSESKLEEDLDEEKEEGQDEDEGDSLGQK